MRPWGEQISLFANYSEGLQPGSIVGAGYANAGEALSPMQTKQSEVGVKFQSQQVTHTVSAFRIEKPSLITDSANNQVADGEQRLTGVEWSASGQLTSTVTLLGGVDYIKSRQVNTGKENFGVPKLRTRIGADWATPIQGLTVGGRWLYTGQQMGQLRQHLARPRLEPHRPDGQVRHQVRHHPRALQCQRGKRHQ